MLFSIIDRTSGHKFNDIEQENKEIYILDPMDIYNTASHFLHKLTWNIY